MSVLSVVFGVSLGMPLEVMARRGAPGKEITASQLQNSKFNVEMIVSFARPQPSTLNQVPPLP
jgi:hypothetical protein